MKTFRKVLVANRGEIALRVMQTCRRMGLGTVAVFSDADENAPHVRFADEAVRLGPAPSRESYLRTNRILDAAKRTGADAVHPGYGFLSENPDFAAELLRAELVFIGPSPDAIRAMGRKREAKALVEKHGVPVVPGFDGGDQTTATLRKGALAVGLPVILKASAGGGGKGMKVVRAPGELDAAIDSARREAESGFGDGTLIVEKYIERPRHVEIQILGDHHGNLVHVFERECSIQRRHQKVVEEAPSSALTDERRARMGEAAVNAARAVGYSNAGTAEFILDDTGHFYFNEMNTRLQVEHRVTERITGLDLVEEQIRVARGERLRFRQEDLRVSGHAVECRLYAEDPETGFLPQTGKLVDFEAPALEGLLVDSGYERGSEVSIHYDPMLAKLVTHGATRDEATARMVFALERLSVAGVTTNRDFLVRLLSHPDYVGGRIHTHFIEEKAAELVSRAPDEERDRGALVAATLAGHESRRARRTVLANVPSGFRNNPFAGQTVEYALGTEPARVVYRHEGEGRFRVTVKGEERTARVVSWDDPVLVVEDGDGVRQRVRVVRHGLDVFVHGPRGAVRLVEKPRYPEPGDDALKGGFVALMPGKVVKVFVKDGDGVVKGQPLVILEAMKMEQTMTAPADGRVKSVPVLEGDQVTANQVLIVMEASA